MEPTICIKFLHDGESPDVGRVVAGEERFVGQHLGQRFIERGIAVEVINGAAAPAEEDVENGGQ